MLALALILGGCVNTRTDPFDGLSTPGNSASGNSASGNSNDSGSGSGDSSSSASSDRSYKISRVTIGAGSGGGNNLSTTILFDAGSPTSFGEVCASASGNAQGDGSKDCVCEFTWNEVNPALPNNTPIPRTAITPVTLVQPFLATCAAPQPYSQEIPDNTDIKIRIIAGPQNSNSFTMKSYVFRKTPTQAGAFVDLRGNVFDNVLRYSCYEQSKRGMKITNRKKVTQNAATGEPASFLMGSRFCVTKASDAGGAGAGGGAECEPQTPENTAQSYYYNLYMPSSRKGEINLEDGRYICPMVKEAIRKPAPGTEHRDFYPLDASFALSVSKTVDFNVGVEALSLITIAGTDTGSAPTSCAASNNNAGAGGGGAGGGQQGDRLVTKCLGFAMKPGPDGTCPFLRNGNGTIRFTYRLRRFVALYPPVYDTDGSPINEPMAADTIYVLDRPVNPGALGDPLKPFTMRGPKPCPFAYFDHKGLLGDPADVEYTAIGDPNNTGSKPGYAATNNPGWNGINIDGIEFPNMDIDKKSCSAAIPIFSRAKGAWSIATLNRRNPTLKHVYIRPIQPWAPHYEEDTGFQACAPLADPFQDPPLHFSKDTASGNVAWCAEAYPTQNLNVRGMEKRKSPQVPFPGRVIPFTSHVTKASNSAACSPTVPAPSSGGEYPGLEGEYPTQPSLSASCPDPSLGDIWNVPAGAAWHPSNLLLETVNLPGNGNITSCTNNPSSPINKVCYYCARRTCDRTVEATGLAWPKFPLLARAPQVEAAIAADSTYGCIVSWDNNGSKAGKASPKNGCCGPSVMIDTGPVKLDPTAAEARGYYRAAHLEPDTPCLIPTY